MSRKKQPFYNNYDTRNIKPSNMQAQDNPSTVDNILKQVQKEQDNSGKWTKQSTKLINSAGTLMGNGKKNGDISDIIDYFRTENNLLIPQDGDPSIIGTSMPFQYNLFSDIILNPSSVSTTEFQKIAYGDPVVYSGLMYTSTVVADMIGDFRHPKKEVSDLVNFNLENMEISKVQLIKFILSALWAGFSVQEKVFGIKRFKGRSRILITDTVPLPPSSLIFRVDTSGKLKDDGIVQYYYNNLWTGYANMLSFNSYNQGGNVSTPNPYAKKGDLDTPLRSVWAQPIGTVILPKRKCIHHTFAGLDGFKSPYGRSILRSTYSYWVQKQAVLQISLIAANYKASPIPIAFVDPTVQVRDASGNVISLAKDVSNAISNFKGNGFLVLNAQKDTMVSIDTIDNTAEIDKYVALLNYYDQQILRSILTPSSLFAVEEGGSYAIGLSHASAHGRIIKMIAEDVANTLLRQYTRDIIDMNFGTEEVNGHFDFLETTIDDKLKYGKMLEFSINKNILNMGDLNDLNTCRYMFGYEPVDKVFVSPASEMGMGQAEQSEGRDGAEEKDALKPAKKKTTGISSKATARQTDTPYSETKD